MKTAFLFLFTLLTSEVFAIKFPAKARRSNSGFRTDEHTTDDGYLSVMNNDNLVYSTTIKLGDDEFVVQLDTGSSDLWVSMRDDTLDTTNTTEILVAVHYPTGSVNGTIAFADFEMGDYRVPSQALILASEVAMDTLRETGNDGVLGLGFDSSSWVNRFVKANYGEDSTTGLSPISNIFHKAPSAPKFFSLLLGRMNDLDDETEGVFTISEYIDGFEAIQNEPKLARQKPRADGALDQWKVELDGISVNGQPLSLKSSKPVGVLDTGIEFAPVDVKVADAIYSSIPGAAKVNGTQIWLVPCLSSTDLVFKLGGKDFAIHPLDLTVAQEIEGYTGCVNTFIGVSETELVDYDLFLSVPFLRNTYAVFNYGSEANSNGENAFVQLLSTTNLEEDKAEFAHVRNEALKSMPALLPPAQLAEIMAKKRLESTYASTEGESVYEGDPKEEDPTEEDEPVEGKDPEDDPKGNNLSSSLEGEDPTNEDDPTEEDPSDGEVRTEPTQKDDPITGAPVTKGLSAAATNDDDDNKLENMLSKVGGYGPVIIALLGANLLFLLVLTAIGVSMCIRRGGKAKSVSRSYTPVKLKDTEAQQGTSYDTPYNH